MKEVSQASCSKSEASHEKDVLDMRPKWEEPPWPLEADSLGLGTRRCFPRWVLAAALHCLFSPVLRCTQDGIVIHSVADPDVNPGSRLHPRYRVKKIPGSWSASESRNLNILTQKIVSKLWEIWSGMFIPDSDPRSGSWFFTHPGSKGQKGNGSRIRIFNTGSGNTNTDPDLSAFNGPDLIPNPAFGTGLRRTVGSSKKNLRT
jgi:hypothetical protein